MRVISREEHNLREQWMLYHNDLLNYPSESLLWDLTVSLNKYKGHLHGYSFMPQNVYKWYIEDFKP